MIRPLRGPLLVFLLPLVSALGDDRHGSMGAAGGDRTIWVYRQLPPDAQGLRPIYTGYLEPGKRFPGFESVPLAPSRGVLQSVTSRAGNLHFFFPDGSHYAMSPSGSPSTQARQTQPDSPETRLPDGVVPLAACGDETTGELLAMVNGEALAGLEAATAEPRGLTINTTGTSPPAESPLPSMSPSPSPWPASGPTPRYGLVAYRSSRWQAVAAGPHLAEEPQVCAMSARDRQVHVFFAEQREAPVMYTALADGAWSPPASVADVRGTQVLGAIVDETGPGLIATQPAGEGRVTVVVLRRVNGVWTRGDLLHLDGATWTAAPGDLAASRWRDELVVLWRGEKDQTDEDIVAGLWPLAGGEALASPVPILALRPASATGTHDSVRMVIAGIVIATVMLVVYARRRDSFLSDAPVPSGFVLASLGRRVAALLADSSLVMALFTPLILLPWLNAHHIELGDGWNSQVNTLIAHEPGEFFWRWMMGVALFALYGTFFEAVFQGTPGKLLMGLRVYDIKARRPRFLAVLVRNLLRVELFFRFDFVPFALLVALTRNRQRLGDLVAQTVVVQKA